MQKKFWLERWEKNETKFNQKEVNPYLLQYKNFFEPLKGKRVLVPLCGKSIDLLWFLKEGAEVIGVEFSALAIESFFKEHHLTYEKTEKKPFIIYSSGALKFICGDFFQLKKEDIGEINWIYDRASIIALNKELRIQYGIQISKLSDRNTQIFMIVLSYDSHGNEGPPFSVPQDEVHELFSKNFQIQLISENERKDVMPHLVKRGLVDLKDSVFLMEALRL